MVVDLNVLIYATNADAARHGPARRWLDGALDGAEAVGFAWVVLVGFVRLSTMRQVFPQPLTSRQAIDQVERWLGARPAVVVEAGSRHLELLASLLEASGTGGNLVNDAHLAALALERRARVATFDADFGRFAGVRVEALGA